MIGPYEIHGHAIVSGDERIANSAARMPAVLRFPADQKQFNAAMDRARVVVLGRVGHVNHPDTRRMRLVVSSAPAGLEKRADAWWWNPAGASVIEALGAAAPGGGLVVIAGGKRVFDQFLELGYDEFHLARAPHVRLPGGVACFTECDNGKTADEVLRERGMVAGPVQMLDPANEVTLTIFGAPR
jgi:dihydrofolate reductase